MAHEPENVIHQNLRRMNAKRDRVPEDVSDLKARLSQMKVRVVGLERRFASLDISLTGVQRRVDGVEQRLDRTDDVSTSPRRRRGCADG